MKLQNLRCLRQLKSRLKRAPRYRIPRDGRWSVLIASRGGVYAIWKASRPVYVGETCHLDHRFGDLARYRRHGFRHRIAASLGVSRKEVVEDLKPYRISFIADFLGRKELEEFLTVRWLGKTPGRLGFCDDIEQIRNA
jgi:hypothetical protein